jgi:hypothetical protein
MGHTVRINFSFPGADPFSVLAIPNYDGHAINNVDDLTDAICQITEAEVMVMNDFDVPWVT